MLAFARAFPGAPLYTSLYWPEGTFPEYASLEVRPGPLDRIGPLRRDHRLALALLAPAVRRQRIDAAVTLCSSSGWAHGYPSTGRKVVYCHTPARWLYQTERYLGVSPRSQAGWPLSGNRPGPPGDEASGSPSGWRSGPGTRAHLGRAAIRLLGAPLRRWDVRAARSAHRYLANSTVTARAVKELYGLHAEVLAPPPALSCEGAMSPVPGMAEGFVLCVARLLAYKNVDAVVDATQRLGVPLVVIGDGPDRHRLEALAGPGTLILGTVDDATLRWCFASCAGLVAASWEDYGLTPLEVAGFGKPSATLRAGGFLDTVVEGTTGVQFDQPVPDQVAAAIEEMLGRRWDAGPIRAHAALFGEDRFARRLQEIVDAELTAAGAAAP